MTRAACSRCITSTIVLFLLIGLASLPTILNPPKAFAAGTTYYVDSVAGSDANSGTSSSSPWQSLAKVNSVTFQPGDQILFKAGDTWNGQLHPLGSGNSSSPQHAQFP